MKRSQIISAEERISEFDIQDMAKSDFDYREIVKADQKFALAKMLVEILNDGKPRCIQFESRERIEYNPEISRHEFDRTRVITSRLAIGLLNPIDAEIGDLVYSLAIAHLCPYAKGDQPLKMRVPSDGRVDVSRHLSPNVSVELRTFVRRSDLWWERVQ